MSDRNIFNMFRVAAAKLRNPFAFLTKPKREVQKRGFGSYMGSMKHGLKPLIVNGRPKRYKHLQEYPKLLGTVKGGYIRVLTKHGIIISSKNRYDRWDLQRMMNKL